MKEDDLDRTMFRMVMSMLAVAGTAALVALNGIIV